MNTIDLVIFIAYCALILFVGLFVSRKKKGEEDVYKRQGYGE